MKTLKRIFRFDVCKEHNWMTNKDYVSFKIGIFWYALLLIIVIPILI